MSHMDKDGFIRHLEGLDRYVSVDERMSLGQIFFLRLTQRQLYVFDNEIFECSKFE
jgi:hypothetical protein